MKTVFLILLMASSAFAQDVYRMGFISNSDKARMDRELAANQARAEEKSRIDAIPSRDFYRILNGVTVSANSPGWVRFYGSVIAFDEQSVVVRGGFNHYEGIFYVRNFPESVAIGKKLDYAVSYHALPIAFRDQKIGPPRPILDYGKVFVAPKVSPEAQAKKKADNAAKALKYNQDLAEKGDAYGQLRMGERYRDGEGVAKDPRQAREWFAKAAAQGDPAAIKALAALP